MRLFVFYLSLGLVRVCEIEISHMGKNNGNPDLACEKYFSLPKAPPISAPLVGILTFTMPQSEPFGLK